MPIQASRGLIRNLILALKLIAAAFAKYRQLYLWGLVVLVSAWALVSLLIHEQLEWLYRLWPVAMYRADAYAFYDPRHILIFAAVLIGALIGIVGYSVIGQRFPKWTDMATYPIQTFFFAGLVAATAPLGVPHIIAVILYYWAYLRFDKAAIGCMELDPAEQREVREWRIANTVRIGAYTLLLLFCIGYDFFLHANFSFGVSGFFEKWTTFIRDWAQHSHPTTSMHSWDRDLYNFISGAVVFEILTGSVGFLLTDKDWFKDRLLD